MQTFQVWFRPLGDSCRIRVDGLENGRWLLSRLNDLAGFDICKSIGHEEPFGCYSFMVECKMMMTQSSLERLLAGIPEVELMCQPA